MADNATKSSALAKPKDATVNLRDYGLLGALVVVVLLFQYLTGGKLLYAGNISDLIMQNAYVVILAIGMIMVIIAGHIDLSVGSGVAMLGGFFAVATQYWHWSWQLTVLATLLFGAVMGAWQGYWVAFVGIPGFITTLSGMLVFRGLALIILYGGTLRIPNAGFVAIANDPLPHWLGDGWFGDRDGVTLVIGVVAIAAMIGSQLRSRAALRAHGLPRESVTAFVVKSVVIGAAILFISYKLSGDKGTPYILLILGVLVLVYTFVLKRTVFGRHVYAMGGNRFAAIMSGVKTRWVDFFIFVNIGVLTAAASIVSTSRAGSAFSSAGNFFELDAIAACFIGGTSVSGGVGKLSGAVTGALLIGVINQSLVILGVKSDWANVVKGLVLIAAVAFDLINRRRSGR